MKHLAKRTLSFVLVLAMLLSAVAVTALAADDVLIAPNPNANPNKHVLEANTLTAFADGKKDGDTEVVEDYFTILYSSKSKVDSSKKTWEDAYASSQRINFGGKATTEKNAVKFTTSGPATVKIWWAQAGDDNREYAILDSAGKVVVKTSGTYKKGDPYMSTLELTEAGTYFLGGETNNNYLFKLEVTETSGTKEYVLDASTFTEADKADAPEEKSGTGDYFTINWGNKGKIAKTEAVFADGFAPGLAVNFDGKSSSTSRFIRFTTTQAATVKIWWYGNGDGRFIHVTDEDGTDVVKTAEGETGKTPNISTLELPDAGTYTLATPEGTCLFMKVVVTEGTAEKAPRAEWADVALPVIKSVETDPEAPGKVNVTVTGSVGYDAADQIAVIMRDGDGWQLKSLNSLAEKDEHVLTFEPSATGTYTFSVAATREKETAVHKGEKTAEFKFTYPLGVPVMKYAVNDGKGGLTVEWNPVKEATGYTVKAGTKTVTTTGINATKAVVSGLTVGSEIDVTVTALRGTETGKPCEAMKVTVSDEAEIAWVFSTFGTSTNTTNDFCELLEDGSVRVVSREGAGKIQPAAEDGLAFYYTAIDPKTTNFVLTVTANVNTWDYNNGQEGFGIGVLDQVGVNGSNAPVWTNSFMLAVAGLSGVSNKRLGVGALARTGVTEYSATKPDSFAGTWLADLSGVSDDVARNLVGKATNQDSLDSRGPTLSPALTSFKLKLEKNDQGYFVTYTDHNGVEHTEKYPEELSQVDDYIYVGMFAARRMDVTFSDISFTTSASSGSSAGTGAEKTVAPDYSFKNPAVSNTETFALDFRANADGKVEITDNAGKELYKGVVKAGEKVTVPVTLAKGDNTFKAVMTPDAAFTVDGAKLTSYEAAALTTTVKYAVDERATTYVSPNGKDDAAGTRADPTTLAAAVKNPAPGATIILLAGTYNLTSGVTVDRGINGTQAKPITLKADPAAATRPVLDWGEKGNGLRINGDWWYLVGFDSTRSTAKGVHIGGNHNVVERVCVYENLNTGLSISRINFGDSIPDWPSYNTILNCSAWLNADAGYEDADGFEAKLTCGVGNVFDGCVAAYNADDGWDLFARGAAIGAVTVKNSVAFKNGWDIVDGKEVNAGNGNGFKLGGGNIPVEHKIVNSVAFDNKANGFTCNSNPALKIENCTAYNNGKGNLALYTNVADLDTTFEVKGFLSYKGGSDDSIKIQGAQVKADYLGESNYYQGNLSGEKVEESWFKKLDTAAAIKSGIARGADGTITLDGCLELTDKAPKDTGARLPAAQTQTFRDVAKGSWYYDAVMKITKLDLVKGTAPGVFNPDGTFTRAEMAVILHRVADNPKASVQSAFKDTDRKAGSWYIDAVDWTNEKGYMTGAGDGKFRPAANITRQELVKTLYVYAKDAGVDVTATGTTAFKDDASIAPWARDAMSWAFASGVLLGDGTGNANPAKTATRGDMAVIIARFVDLLNK